MPTRRRFTKISSIRSSRWTHLIFVTGWLLLECHESPARCDPPLGGFTPSYILHTRAFWTCLLGGLFTLQKRLWGDCILHVNMFHYFKMPYFTCIFFTKCINNEYIGTHFFIPRCSKFFASEPFEIPPRHFTGLYIVESILWYFCVANYNA